MMNDMLTQLMQRVRQQQQQQGQGMLDAAAQQPIPGFTGPVTSGAGMIPGVGMAPPQQPLPGGGGQVLQPFMASGPYGQQAMQLAGLMGQRRGFPQFPVGGAQINSMMGAKARMPFYRPVGK